LIFFVVLVARFGGHFNNNMSWFVVVGIVDGNHCSMGRNNWTKATTNNSRLFLLSIE